MRSPADVYEYHKEIAGPCQDDPDYMMVYEFWLRVPGKSMMLKSDWDRWVAPERTAQMNGWL